MKNSFIQSIEKLRADEYTLRRQIEAFLLKNELVIGGFDLSSLHLQHQIHERPASHINIQYDRVTLCSGKGYTNFLNEVSMTDIETILKFILEKTEEKK